MVVFLVVLVLNILENGGIDGFVKKFAYLIGSCFKIVVTLLDGVL